MNGQNETCHADPSKSSSGPFNYAMRLQELQAINEVLIETSQIEDEDRICRLTGEAVIKLNNECQVIISLYDESMNALRTKVAIGFESIAGNIADILNLNPDNIHIEPKELELNSHDLKSGKLEYFEGGLYALLAKKVPYDLVYFFHVIII